MKLPKPLPLQISSIPSLSNLLPLQVNSLQSEINRKLIESLTYICNHPSIFVSESDIHHLVKQHLMSIDELNPNKSLHTTNCTIGSSNKGVSKVNYKTMLMHSEYGVHDSPNSRFDIVVLNPFDVNNIDDPINLKKNGKWLQPDYIFEFGTEKSASGEPDFIKHLLGDLNKVTKAQKQGYLIHIHRNYQRSTGILHANNTAKFEFYIESYKKLIGSFPNNFKSPVISIPKIIFILIDIGGDNRIVRGKIRILIDPLKPNCKLTRINLKSIETELQNLV